MPNRKKWYRNPWLIGSLVIVVLGGIWIYRSRSTTTTAVPVTTQAEQGTLVQSVTGSGSLIAKIQADITASTYGTVQNLFVKNGDEVTATQPLLRLHSLASDADKTKALASLLSAQDSLNQATTKLTTLAQSATTAQQLLQDAQKNEGINATTLNSSQLAYNKSKIDAQKELKDAEKEVIDAASTQNKANTDLDTSAAQVGQESASLGLDSTKIGNKQSVITAQKTLQEAQRDQASAHLKTQSAQLAYTAAQQTLQNQKGTIAASEAALTSSRLSYQLLTDQTVTSPVAGRIVNFSLAEGQTVGAAQQGTTTSTNSSNSNASSTKLFSIIDFKSLKAVVAVSEVDVANIKEGQPATLTFDAIAGKTFTGTVTNVDTIGTTTSGVTNYNVEITLDSFAPLLKPGMTVSASIITNKKDNILLVPSSAVRTEGNQTVVDVIRNGSTQTINVTVGESNDSQTEITQGLQPGEIIVTSTPRTSGAPSAFSGRGNGFSGFGGGGARALGR